MIEIKTFNATNLFNRITHLRMLGDMRLPVAIPIPMITYFFGSAIIWSPPFLAYYFLVSPTLFPLALAFVPPAIFAASAGKPNFPGKRFFLPFFFAWCKHLMEPRGFADSKPDDLRPRRYYVSQETGISRRRELQELQEAINQKAQQTTK